MEKKLQVLMELKPCFYGFSGIPQETRLLFSYFQNLPNICTTGLLNIESPDLTCIPLVNHWSAPKEEHAKINQASKLIISSDISRRPSPLDILHLIVRHLFLSIGNLLGSSITMGEFNSKGFEDFLWEKLFAKTLPTEQFEQMTQSLFRTLTISRVALQLSRIRNAFPKIKTEGYDVFLTQTPFPGRVGKNTQLVVRYHDAVPLFVPHLIHNPKPHQASHYNQLCSNAKTAFFVCTSHAVRADLLQIFPQLEQRSKVIHDTISPNYFEEKTSEKHLSQIIRNYSYESRRAIIASEEKDDEFYQKHLNESPFTYILMVSTIEPRKNQIRLIKAWEAVRLKLKMNMKLIFVGDLGWQTEPIIAAMRPWQQQGQLFHLQKVPIDRLRQLYHGAACVICPSVKEGFDLSGIEAMACGGKVVASDISVHREIYADAAIYFDPYSFQHQAEAIESIVDPGSNFPSALREKGLQQAKQYQKSAIQPQWESFFEDMPKMHESRHLSHR